jgi:hypothetical protein
VVEKIDKVSEIDYTLLSAPVSTASYVETNHKVLTYKLMLEANCYPVKMSILIRYKIFISDNNYIG